ncbi:DUF3500 domain-containing protein [Herbiconiux sp. P16]|uniref:DUF3500 domain-containing protein n=1 Tax=Herbiconiux wuyangfengii TaxID=3342794 RepID=UPI0035BB1C5E
MTSFRRYLFPDDDQRITSLRGLDPREYARVATTDPFAGPMIEGWARLYPEPYVGITANGAVDLEAATAPPVLADEAAPTMAMVDAANALLATLDETSLKKLCYPAEAHEWRSWANPEFLQHDTGLRLEELSHSSREAALHLIRVSLSESGYRLVRELMYINGYLGEIVGLSALMNEFSYNIALFGQPSPTEPWGWNFFGHHVALNCVVQGPRLALAPVFLGAEPSIVDDGPRGGLRVLDDRIVAARRVMRALPEELQREIVLYDRMVDPRMPPGRLHPGDERHLAGCFQDNRVIAPEGLPVQRMPEHAQEEIRALANTFLDVLPAGPARAWLREIDAHLEATTFCWIGGTGSDDPFYLRLQSPVVIVELDHHTGVFLSNEEPAAFHIHSIMRIPNGRDYGGLLRGPGGEAVAG